MSNGLQDNDTAPESADRPPLSDGPTLDTNNPDISAKQDIQAEAEPKETALQPASRPAAAAAPRTPKAPIKSGPPDKPSKGEKAYRWLNYTGIGYLTNLAVSLVVWDFFLTGRGKPAMDGAARGFAKLLRSGGMEAAKATKTGELMAKMGASPLGGHLTMIPLKIGEDHQRYLSHRLNQALDPNYEFKDIKADWNTPEEDLPELTKEATKQTWGQVAIRRGLAWTAVTAAGTALGQKNSEALESWTLGKVDGGIKSYGSKGLQDFARTNQTFQRYTKLAALDTYFTVITSMVAYVTNSMFGKKRGSAQEIDILNDDVLIDSRLDDALRPPPLEVFADNSPPHATSRVAPVSAIAPRSPVEPKSEAGSSFADKVEPAQKRHTAEKHDKYSDLVAAEKAQGGASPTLAV